MEQTKFRVEVSDYDFKVIEATETHDITKANDTYDKWCKKYKRSFIEMTQVLKSQSPQRGIKKMTW